MRPLLALLLVLVLPATAAAGDLSVAREWDRYQRSGERINRLVRDLDGARQADRALEKGLRLISKTRRDIAGERASTRIGAQARKAALDHLEVGADALRRLGSILALTERSEHVDADSREGRRLARQLMRKLRRVDKRIERADKLEDRAERLFERATS